MNIEMFAGANSAKMQRIDFLLMMLLVSAIFALLLYLHGSVRDHIKARVAAGAGAYVLMIAQKRDRIRFFRRTSVVSRVQRNGYLEYYVRSDRFKERYSRFLFRALIVESSDNSVYKKMSRAGMLSNLLLIPEGLAVCAVTVLKFETGNLDMFIKCAIAVTVLSVIYIIYSLIRGDKDVNKYAYEYGTYDGATRWLELL